MAAESNDWPDSVIGAPDHADPFYPFTGTPAKSIRVIDREMTATDFAILRSLGIEWSVRN